MQLKKRQTVRNSQMSARLMPSHQVVYLANSASNEVVKLKVQKDVFGFGDNSHITEYYKKNWLPTSKAYYQSYMAHLKRGTYHPAMIADVTVNISPKGEKPQYAPVKMLKYSPV